MSLQFWIQSKKLANSVSSTGGRLNKQELSSANSAFSSSNFFRLRNDSIKPWPCRWWKFCFATGMAHTWRQDNLRVSKLAVLMKSHQVNLPLQYLNLLCELAHSAWEQTKSKPCGASMGISMKAVFALWSSDNPLAWHNTLRYRGLISLCLKEASNKEVLFSKLLSSAMAELSGNEVLANISREIDSIKSFPHNFYHLPTNSWWCNEEFGSLHFILHAFTAVVVDVNERRDIKNFLFVIYLVFICLTSCSFLDERKCRRDHKCLNPQYLQKWFHIIWRIALQYLVWILLLTIFPRKRQMNDFQLYVVENHVIHVQGNRIVISHNGIRNGRYAG
jgi:hypothetical protein